MWFIEVNKYVSSLEAINYFVAYMPTEWKAKFQLEVSENKVVIFFPIHVHGPLKPPRGPWTPD